MGKRKRGSRSSGGRSRRSNNSLFSGGTGLSSGFRSWLPAAGRVGQQLVGNPQVQKAIMNAAYSSASSAVDRISSWMNSPSFRANPGRPAPITPRKGKPRRKMRWGTAKGVYVGKFKQKPSKASGKGLIAKSLKSGYHLTKETFGTVTDPHCAYIGHNTMDYTILSRALSGAIHRKLFEKAGIQITSSNVEIPLIATGVSGPSAFFINMIFKNNVTGNGMDLIYEIPDDIDLKALVNANVQLLNYLFAYLVANGPQEDDELIEMRLYERVANLPTDERRLRCRLDMTKESLTIVVKSHLRVQNRTKGDSTEVNADADRVDNVPVDGKMYTFKHAHAKLASKTPNLNLLVRFNAMPQNGVVLARSADNYTETLAEPPNQQIFTNCVGTNNIHLNPGDIKDCHISHVYKGRFGTLVNKLRAKNTTNLGVGQPYYYSYGVPGKMQLVVLEEMIRSISSNDIILVYERNLEIGCFLKSRNPKYALTTELVVEKDDQLPS